MNEEKSLLALVMIVRNEAPSMARIIESVRDQVDCAVIVDTGSTDGTAEIARQALGEIPRDIYEYPFVDFATTRNQSLDLAAPRAVFGLLLSGDETLVDPDGLVRRHCIETRDRTDDLGAWNVQLSIGGTKFFSTRLVRLSAGWRYVGEVHEVLVKPGHPPVRARIDGPVIVHAATDPDRKRLRLYRDLEILREKMRQAPEDTRTQFYLAQTISELGMHAQAFEAYKRRVTMATGFVEEQYEAAFRMAMTSMLLGRPWPETQELFLEAHAIDPRRAEPIHQVANYWRFQKNWPLCWMFASYGAEISYPNDCVLFVDVDVYRYRLAELASIAGFYVGQMDRGRRYAEKAAAARPEDARLKENLAKYESVAKT